MVTRIPWNLHEICVLEGVKFQKNRAAQFRRVRAIAWTITRAAARAETVNAKKDPKSRVAIMLVMNNPGSED